MYGLFVSAGFLTRKEINDKIIISEGKAIDDMSKGFKISELLNCKRKEARTGLPCDAVPARHESERVSLRSYV